MSNGVISWEVTNSIIMLILIGVVIYMFLQYRDIKKKADKTLIDYKIAPIRILPVAK